MRVASAQSKTNQQKCWNWTGSSLERFSSSPIFPLWKHFSSKKSWKPKLFVLWLCNIKHFKVTFPEILVEISAASTLKVYDIKFQTFKLLHIPTYMKQYKKKEEWAKFHQSANQVDFFCCNLLHHQPFYTASCWLWRTFHLLGCAMICIVRACIHSRLKKYINITNSYEKWKI